MSPWPMARLDTSQLKSFNARRKWHVSFGECVCVCIPRERRISILEKLHVCRTPPHVNTPSCKHTLTPNPTPPHAHTPSLLYPPLTHLQTMSVAVDPTTVFGPRSILCASPLLPNFEEMARNECKSQTQTSFSNHHGNKRVLSRVKDSM